MGAADTAWLLCQSLQNKSEASQLQPLGPVTLRTLLQELGSEFASVIAINSILYRAELHKGACLGCSVAQRELLPSW